MEGVSVLRKGEHYTKANWASLRGFCLTVWAPNSQTSKLRKLPSQTSNKSPNLAEEPYPETFVDFSAS